MPSTFSVHRGALRGAPGGEGAGAGLDVPGAGDGDANGPPGAMAVGDGLAVRCAV